jgi:hypothetical protein
MNEAIINLFVQRVILGSTPFEDVPNKLKDDVEKALIDSGLGYFTIKDELKEENKNG